MALAAILTANKAKAPFVGRVNFSSVLDSPYLPTFF